MRGSTDGAGLIAGAGTSPSAQAVAGRGELLLRRVLAGSGVDPDAVLLAEPGADRLLTGGRVEDGPAAGEAGDGPLRHAVRLPPRPGHPVPWPEWVPGSVVDALGRAGVRAPWSHQAEGAELAHAGRDVVVATGTASGKSLVYQLPVLSRFAAETRATALYLSPTKALAADQLRSLAVLGLEGVRPAAFDGDTPMEERDWARRNARWIFSNPDMLHRSLLPRHGRWAAFLRRLSFVVLDECHTYRGVFGSHVALLLRRLLRIAERYGARPTLVLASATVAEPAAFASRLTGRDVVAITEDASPSAGRTVALWEPPLLPELAGRTAPRSAARPGASPPGCWPTSSSRAPAPWCSSAPGAVRR